jgi:hypothetical protein
MKFVPDEHAHGTPDSDAFRVDDHSLSRTWWGEGVENLHLPTASGPGAGDSDSDPVTVIIHCGKSEGFPVRGEICPPGFKEAEELLWHARIPLVYQGGGVGVMLWACAIEVWGYLIVEQKVVDR